MLGAPRGRLRVTAPHSIGSTILPPVIAGFLQDHPAVEVDLHLDDRRIDLLPENVDAAIRVGELEDTSLMTRALAPLELVVCAAPSYLARRGEPNTLAELASHDCLDFEGSSNPGIWCFDTNEGPAEISVAGPFRANGGYALRTAALGSLGIIMLPKVILESDIRFGRLLPLLEDYHPQSRPVQLLTLPDRYPTPKLRCFTERLVRELGSGTKT